MLFRSREVREETGLDIEVTSLLGVYSESQSRLVTYPGEREPVHLVDIIVEGRVTSGRLRGSEESQEVRFFDHDSLPPETQIAPPAVAPLLDYIRGRTGVIR